MERLVRQGTLDMALVHRIPTGCTFDTHRLGEEAYVAVLPKGTRASRTARPCAWKTGRQTGGSDSGAPACSTTTSPARSRKPASARRR